MYLKEASIAGFKGTPRPRLGWNCFFPLLLLLSEDDEAFTERICCDRWADRRRAALELKRRCDASVGGGLGGVGVKKLEGEWVEEIIDTLGIVWVGQARLVSTVTDVDGLFQPIASIFFTYENKIVSK